MRPPKCLSLLLAILVAVQPCLADAWSSKDAGDSGSGAGVTSQLLEKVMATGRFDLGATAELLTDPGTLKGALGGFLGFTLAAKVSALFMPPGVGIFVQMLPRFLGGALGFELARGKMKNIDPVAMAFHAAAASAGYSAMHLLLGASAPGWALMGGAMVVGALANLLTRKKVIAEERPEAPESAAAVPGASVGANPVASSPAAPAGAKAADREAREAYRQLAAGSAEGDRGALPGLLERYDRARDTLSSLRVQR